ncbi:MAG: glycosyltransferase family 4 protein, partial [Planctomycetaceae bacterium]|nr:glycosyltransferase family 4 protein [Planctomycetaceae bacterium]
VNAARVAPDRRRGITLLVRPYLDTPLVGRMSRHFLYRDLRQNPPDLIHVQWRGMLSLGRWLAKRFRRPYVVTMHDYLEPQDRFKYDHTWGRGIVAVSESVKQDLLQRTNLPPDLVTVIHSGVPTAKSNRPEGGSERTRTVLDEGHTPVVGTAGPLEAAKGLDYFLRAARIVAHSRPDVQFLIAGAGPDESRLRRMVAELKLTGQVTFVPNIYDFSYSLEAMDIFCLPALKQGLGTIMLEAMALGRPVIATRAGGVDTVVDEGNTGLLVAPSDSDDLARGVLDLLADPARARQIGIRGRDIVGQQFRVDTMVAMTAQLYRRIIEAEQSRQPAMAEHHS